VTGDGNRCRWHVDGPGRCPNVQQFPGMRDVPPFCAAHLGALEPWVAARAAQRAGSAPDWIAWARRRAEDADRDMRMVLGGRTAGR